MSHFCYLEVTFSTILLWLDYTPEWKGMMFHSSGFSLEKYFLKNRMQTFCVYFVYVKHVLPLKSTMRFYLKDLLNKCFYNIR